MDKICIFCKNWYLDQGSPDYSDVTPGEDAMTGCEMGRWNIPIVCDNYPIIWGTHLPEGNPHVGESYYRKCLLTAKDCPEFDPIEEYNGD